MTDTKHEWAHEGSSPTRFEGCEPSAEAAAYAGFAWHGPSDYVRRLVAQLQPAPRRYIRVGEIQRFRAEDFAPDGEALAEWMFEQACDRAGESEDVDSWPDASAAQHRELGDAIEAVVKAWADKFELHPKFFTIHDDSVKVYEAVSRDPDGDVTAIRAVSASELVELEKQGKL